MRCITQQASGGRLPPANLVRDAAACLAAQRLNRRVARVDGGIDFEVCTGLLTQNIEGGGAEGFACAQTCDGMRLSRLWGVTTRSLCSSSWSATVHGHASYKGQVLIFSKVHRVKPTDLSAEASPPLSSAMLIRSCHQSLRCFVCVTQAPRRTMRWNTHELSRQSKLWNIRPRPRWQSRGRIGPVHSAGDLLLCPIAINPRAMVMNTPFSQPPLLARIT